MNKEFRKYVRSNSRRFFTLFILLFILLAVFYGKEYFNSPYVFNDDGSVSHVNVENRAGVMIHIKASRNGITSERDVMLLPDKGKQVKEKDTSHNEEEALLNSEIERIVSTLEKEKKSVLKLPVKGQDGIKIKWSYKRNYRPLLIIIFFPLIPVMFFISKKEKEREKEKEKDRNIKRGIPKFNHELVLLLDSGMVFSDAFEKIAESYSKDLKEDDYLKNAIVSIYEEAESGRESLVTVLNRYSHNISNREFSRITSIISDHQYRGSDLRYKLKDESRLLWDARKKSAEAEGKKGETRLSFPLALLLIVLVIITAAPAMLEM